MKISAQPVPEYLKNKDQIDNYLKECAKILRTSIDSALNGETKLCAFHIKSYENLKAPEIYDTFHQIIFNRLKRLKEILDRMEMYHYTGNEQKLLSTSEELVEAIYYIVGGFFALIKILYDFPEKDSNIYDIAKHIYPEMCIENFFNL